VAAGAGLVYALGCLDLIGDLSAWIDRRSLLYFEPIALFELGTVLWLFSSLNLLLAAVIGSLFAGNLRGVWHLWRRRPPPPLPWLEVPCMIEMSPSTWPCVCSGRVAITPLP